MSISPKPLSAKAAQLGDWLKTPNPNAPMRKFYRLRHQDGDAGITRHYSSRYKATVEAAGTAVLLTNGSERLHNDTFVNGPLGRSSPCDGY